MERWLPIVGWEDFYEVSDLGRVRTLPGGRYASGPLTVGHLRHYRPRVLKQQPSPRGYCYVGLSRGPHHKSAQVHTLVLEAFVGPKPSGMECRHLDGSPGNNRLENLRWGTKVENGADKIRHGTSGVGETNAAAKLTWSEVRQIRKLLGDGVSRSKLAVQFGITYWHVRDIQTGKIWRETSHV